MELKRDNAVTNIAVGSLLIVPYGIETVVIMNDYTLLSQLLIVPYGIET